MALPHVQQWRDNSIGSATIWDQQRYCNPFFASSFSWHTPPRSASLAGTSLLGRRWRPRLEIGCGYRTKIPFLDMWHGPT